MYEYVCEANGQSVDAVHSMSERYTTWGELCEGTKTALGDTPADTPVARLIGGGSVNNDKNALSKRQARSGAESKWGKNGPMAAPMRTKTY